MGELYRRITDSVRRGSSGRRLPGRDVRGFVTGQSGVDQHTAMVCYIASAPPAPLPPPPPPRPRTPPLQSHVRPFRRAASPVCVGLLVVSRARACALAAERGNAVARRRELPYRPTEGSLAGRGRGHALGAPRLSRPSCH
eukprot:358811-Chlamydomonas_euryale.AAC.14